MGPKSYITPEIRALVGKEDKVQATEPVDAGKIRRFAKSLGVSNPAYFDLEKNQPIAHPTFIFSVNHDSMGDMDETGRPANRLSLGPPFEPAIRGGNKYQFFRPVRIGDHLRIQKKITDVKEKQGRTGVLVFITYDLKYTDQQEELLGINTETLIFRVPRPGKGKRDRTGVDFSLEKTTEGREIPPLSMKVSKVRMMMYAAATWNPYQIHWDTVFSQQIGLQDANIAGPMFGDYLAEMLALWVGELSRLKSLEFTIRAMGFPGDTLVCKGKVQRLFEEGNQSFADCQVWVENQKEQLLAEGKAVVSLP